MTFDKRARSGYTVALRLSTEQRDLIRTGTSLPQELVDKLRFGIVDGDALVFMLQPGEVKALVDSLSAKARQTADKNLGRTLFRMCNRITLVLDAWLEERSGELSGRDLPPSLQEEMESLLRSRGFDSAEEAHEEYRKLVAAYNRTPRAEFNQLSPYQVDLLIHSDWQHPSDAIRLNEDIPLSQLQGARVLLNARILLQAAVDSDGIKATTAGNLNRKFVLEMLEAMHWLPRFREDVRHYRKALNEEMVLPLHKLRAVLDIGGLIRRTKGSFRVTKKGKSMMPEGRAGALYALLFRTWFRKFNLAYLDYMAECSSLQDTIGFSLFMLARHAQTWQPIEKLPPTLLLPSVKREIPESQYGDNEECMVRSRIVKPLESFGLLEGRYHSEDRHSYNPPHEVRKTELFDEFLSFDIES
jgi:hypothetical protein